MNTTESDPPPIGLTVSEWATIAHLQSQPKTRVARLQERPVEESAKPLQTARSLGDLPLVVLTAATHAPIDVELQRELAERSTRGRQILVEGSGHMIPFEAPNAIITAIRELLSDIRQSTAAPVGGA